MKLDLNKKRSMRNRKKLKRVNVGRYRITVSKSLKNISAQIIDDTEKKTIVSASSNEKKITKVYFDRGASKYHGRIKSLAEALRKNGLNF